STATRGTRNAPAGHSSPGCRRSTYCSTAARKAAACCSAGRRCMSRALPPETSTTRWYATHVRRYGYGYRALGFGRRASQEKRFAALLALGDFHRRRVLDAGCGFGDFLAYLQARGMTPEYTGFDICAPMIERCRKRFNGTARFM